MFYFAELSETATSCCKYCISFLERRLGLRKWSATEVEALKKGLSTHGSNWNLISKLVSTKRLRDCVQYFRRHSAELMCTDGMTIQLPSLAEDECSPFSDTSSSDDETTLGLSDTGPSVIKVSYHSKATFKIIIISVKSIL